MSYQIALCALLLAAAPAVADDDVDVRSFEYVDVIETTEGNVLRGVIVEQEPGVRYKLATVDGNIHVVPAQTIVKLTKARNNSWRPRATPASNGVHAADSAERRATDGTRGEIEVAVLSPQGAIDALDTSFAPAFRFGHERFHGNLSLTTGGMARFTYWMLPGDTGDALWTLEAHGFVRGAVHAGRAAPYLGVSLGTDLNYLYSKAADMSETTLSFGLNLSFGIAVAASPDVAIDFGGDYHPPTDEIGRSDDSIEYFAIRIGARLGL